MKRICIAGYAGCGNLGDDAILQGLLSELSPPDRVVALTGSPRRDRLRFGIPCRSRRNPIAILRTLRASDVLLLGGGSLLQNETSRRSLLYYLFLLRAAALCGCEIHLPAAGIGPLRGALAQRLTLRALRPCSSVSLRDEESLRLLSELGLDPRVLFRTEDPAGRLPPPPPSRLRYLLMERGLEEESAYFCILPRGAAREAEALAEALRPLFPAATPVVLPLDRSDVALARALQGRLGGVFAAPRDVSEAMAWIGGATAVLSMRLHGLVLAHALGTAATGLSRQTDGPKLRAFCREHGLPHRVICGTSEKKPQKGLDKR